MMEVDLNERSLRERKQWNVWASEEITSLKTDPIPWIPAHVRNKPGCPMSGIAS